MHVIEGNLGKIQTSQRRLMAIGEMTAQLTHQIRTQLASAVLYAEHLASQLASDSHGAQWIARIQNCHAHIEQQIQDLLAFVRGESVEPIETNIQDWCEQLLERAQPLIQAQSVDLVLSNQLGEKTIPLYNESFMGAVLNIIINAVQAEATRITLIIQQLGRNKVQFKIADNGLGMSSEEKSQAFNPFFTTKQQGTGLGLAVVDTVVKNHKGEVLLDSVRGKGSCITINLPR